MKQLRILARSPRKQDGESNADLCARLGITAPFEKLCVTVFLLWKRRSYLSRSSPSSDILAQIPSLCKRARNHDVLLYPWWRQCLPVWQNQSLITQTNVETVNVLTLLGLEATFPAEQARQSPFLPQIG